MGAGLIGTGPMALRGRLVNGLGEATGFTAIDWVRQAFLDRLGIDVFPGTVNLEIGSDQLADWAAIKASPGITIPPGQPGFCDATAWPVRIDGRVSAAILLPHVEDYPADKVELIAAVPVRETLGIGEGDVVTMVLEARQTA